MFQPASDRQQMLGRILVLSDAAHNFGSLYKGNRLNPADIVIYSFHAVKNLTTAEGGAICLNLPAPFDNAALKPAIKRYSLNGQTKDALAKSQAGSWRYDITELGFKFNMPDICAAIGLAQLRIYDDMMLERWRVFSQYRDAFSQKSWAVLPPEKDVIRQTSAHLYMLRIQGITESQRDEMISEISHNGVSVNVHFIPMPMMTLFKDRAYCIEDFPNSYKQYACEISLPIYPQLTKEQVDFIIDVVCQAVTKVTGFN